MTVTQPRAAKTKAYKDKGLFAIGAEVSLFHTDYTLLLL